MIADYPGSTFDIGQVLVTSGLVDDWLQTDNFLHGIKRSAAINYPHLFRLMHWSEERKPEDMPKYVKHIYRNRIVEISAVVELKFWNPATEQEYLEYGNSQTPQH